MCVEDLYFVQNLHEEDKMEFLSEVTYHTYWASSIFSLDGAVRGDFLALGNPSKERDTWKGKCENIENKCSKFSKEIVSLQEKVSHVEVLQEEEKVMLKG